MSPRIPIRVLATQSDERLVGLVRDGHERAFEALVHRYRRPLLRYCRRLRLSETRAEDVLQQSFTQAWVALAGGAEVRDLRAWLYRIAHNTAVSSMRGASSEQAILREVSRGSQLIARDGDIESSMAARSALGEVAALPPMQREAMFLTVAGGSHEEVADVLGISGGAVRGLLYRARSTLRSAAAALTPPWWIARALKGSGGSERAAELAGGGSAAVGVGVIAKSAAVALTAGVIATGAAIAPLGGSEHHRRAASVNVGADAALGGARAAADRAVLAQGALSGDRPRSAARDGRGRGGRASHGRSDSRRGGGAGSEDRPGAGEDPDASGTGSPGADGRGGGAAAGEGGGSDDGPRAGSDSGSGPGSGSGSGSGEGSSDGGSSGGSSSGNDVLGGPGEGSQGGPGESSRSAGGDDGVSGSSGGRAGSSQATQSGGASVLEAASSDGQDGGSAAAGGRDSGH